nr:subtilisin-like protease SBT4.4 [Quercus suber]
MKGSSVNPLETEWHHLVAFPQEHTSSSYQAIAILGRILKEKIVLCDDLEQKKLAKSDGASGIIFQNEKSQLFAHDYDEVPSVGINSKQAKKIQDEISLTKVAAGVDICVPHFTNRGTYTLKAGTSYACPFVAAKAALIKLKFEKKSLKPSPAWMHSALITTASHFEEMVDDSFAIGAGIVNSVEALDPGLIYDLKEEDHAKFLYGQGYDKELTEIFNYEAKVISRITTKGIIITVEPEVLHFPVMNTSQQFKVVLRVDPEHWIPEVVTARLEWRGKEGDKQRSVKSPIVIIMKD